MLTAPWRLTQCRRWGHHGQLRPTGPLRAPSFQPPGAKTVGGTRTVPDIGHVALQNAALWRLINEKGDEKMIAMHAPRYA